MTDKTIHSLTAITTPDSTDEFVIEHLPGTGSYATSKITFSNLADSLPTKTVLLGHGNDSTVNASSTSYGGFGYQGLSATAIPILILPYGGKVKNLRMRLGSTQPASGSMIAILQYDTVDTAISISIPSGQTTTNSLSDTTDTVTVVAGHNLRLKFVNFATGSSGAIDGFSLELDQA